MARGEEGVSYFEYFFFLFYFRHQRLFLLNDSAEQSIHFQAMILGEHSDFEVHFGPLFSCQKETFLGSEKAILNVRKGR